MHVKSFQKYCSREEPDGRAQRALVIISGLVLAEENLPPDLSAEISFQILQIIFYCSAYMVHLLYYCPGLLKQN